jgi:CheY-like chemotaxis protein
VIPEQRDAEFDTGATFRIVLPGVAALEPPDPLQTVGAEPAGAEPAEAEPAEAEPAARRTVLVVEDEPSLRRLVVLMLEEQGFKVLAASNGGDALEIAEHYDGPVQLLLTDVVMPGMTGPELAKRLRGVRPGLKILYMSGYNDSRLVSHDVEQGVDLLVKPFTPDEFLGRVETACDAQAPRDRPGNASERELAAARGADPAPGPLRPSCVLMTSDAGGPASAAVPRSGLPTPSCC